MNGNIFNSFQFFFFTFYYGMKLFMAVIIHYNLYIKHYDRPTFIDQIVYAEILKIVTVLN